MKLTHNADVLRTLQAICGNLLCYDVFTLSLLIIKNFLFNKLVIQEHIISFPNICQFSKILLIIDFFLFKPLCLGKILDVILILLNVLRLILWLSI